MAIPSPSKRDRRESLSTGSSITLAAGSSISGSSSVSASADTVSIDASYHGGAQISGPLLLAVNQLELTTAAAGGNMIVGNSNTDTGNVGALGFIDNSTITRYVAAVQGGSGTLVLTAGTSITVDATGDVDVRQVSGGFSTADALNVELTAPTITLASDVIRPRAGGQSGRHHVYVRKRHLRRQHGRFGGGYGQRRRHRAVRTRDWRHRHKDYQRQHGRFRLHRQRGRAHHRTFGHSVQQHHRELSRRDRRLRL